jgi:hypothetical protein
MYKPTYAYDKMVEDIEDRLGADQEPGVIRDLAEHGADAGWGGFTYTVDCVEFFDAHEDTIMDMAWEDAENFGYPNVVTFVASFGQADMADSIDGYKNLMAWYALETVCRRLADEREDEDEGLDC